MPERNQQAVDPYPDTNLAREGKSTLRAGWVRTLLLGIESEFFRRPDVFVASGLAWHPTATDPSAAEAPDVMVVFGRPKADRRNYKQWVEGDVPPQVVIEILSPSNSLDVQQERRKFYDRYRVEEYYEYDPEGHQLAVWTRPKRGLRRVRPANGFVSPRLGVRFEVPGTEPMRVIRPDGRPFPTYPEIIRAADDRDRLAAKLRELGVDPDSV